jgi:hypothetical protein
MIKKEKSGWQSINHDPSKFKKSLESSTAIPKTFEESVDFIKRRTWKTEEGLVMTAIKTPADKKPWQTLGDLHFHNIKTMMGYFYMENREPPLSVSATDGETAFCFHRGEDIDRVKMCKELRKVFIEKNVQRYAVISGAWYTKHKKGEKIICSPSQNPNRKECIFLYSEDINGKFCFSGWDIIERQKGKRELKETHSSINKDIDPKDEAHLRGKFMGLLQHLGKEGGK